MKAWTKWRDWGTLVLGAILFLAPWLFGTATNASSSWNAWVFGLILVIVALLAVAQPKVFAYDWLFIVAGAWLFIAPWVLGFAAVGAAAWTAWIIGFLVVALAVWKLAEIRSLQTRGAA